VLDWLGVEWAEAVEPLPGPDERFPWEPAPPAPRPPQWGAANLPELLLGLDEAAAAPERGAVRAPGPAGAEACAVSGPDPASPLPS
jgi:hypothetical protein